MAGQTEMKGVKAQVHVIGMAKTPLVATRIITEREKVEIQQEIVTEGIETGTGHVIGIAMVVIPKIVTGIIEKEIVVDRGTKITAEIGTETTIEIVIAIGTGTIVTGLHIAESGVGREAVPETYTAMKLYNFFLCLCVYSVNGTIFATQKRGFFFLQ